MAADALTAALAQGVINGRSHAAGECMERFKQLLGRHKAEAAQGGPPPTQHCVTPKETRALLEGVIQHALITPVLRRSVVSVVTAVRSCRVQVTPSTPSNPFPYPTRRSNLHDSPPSH